MALIVSKMFQYSMIFAAESIAITVVSDIYVVNVNKLYHCQTVYNFIGEGRIISNLQAPVQ